MINKLKNLLGVKSIVTISMCALFIVLALNGVITGEQVLNIFTVIIAFYFGTQVNKNNNE